MGCPPNLRARAWTVLLCAVLTHCTQETAPTEPPGTEPEASEVEIEEDPAQFDFAGEPDEAPLYASPAIERARAIRTGRKIKLRLKWSPVVDATQYEVQIARNLTFASTSYKKRTRRLALSSPALRAGLYFVRIRAIGELG
ncbi:MAG: hypothetical protein AAF658_20395, partial [Myxococcota bacterium]